MALLCLGALLEACGGSASTRSSASRTVTGVRQATTTQAQTIAALRVRAAGALPNAVQDPASTALGDHAVLVGGLDQADVSIGEILLAGPDAVDRVGSVADPVHDAAAATLDGRAYVFGGGEPSRSEILAIDANGRSSSAGALPVGASDVAAAALGRTAYIVGGYTGTRALDTILAWRGSGTARAVATLPHPLRYAAVAASEGRLVIAGGTSGTRATREVYAFDPTNGRVSVLALLPAALTHAAAVTLHGIVYVIGGRGTARDSQTSQILAIDPTSGRVSVAGQLPRPLSDLGAAATGGQVVLLAGGRQATGRLSDELLLLSAG